MAQSAGWLIDNIWMVPVYPLIATVLIILGRGLNLYKIKELSMSLTVLSTFCGLIHALFALQWMFGQGEHVVPIEQNYVWLSAGAIQLSMGYLLDSMSVMMLFVVTFVSLLIQIYTHGYMKHDAGYSKFYAYLALFNFSMLGLVLSTNLFQIYVFWELVGVSSYLLIGFWFTRPSAAKAAVKAFMMNRVGDFGFLVGILTLVYFTVIDGGNWWQQHLAANPDQAFLSFRALGDAAPYIMENVGPLIFAIMALLIFMGPMAKSAQLPLHTWLPDAMEGPTPISALIHAATMVAAGVYLVGRTYPIFMESSSAMVIVAVLGTATALVAATIAVTQVDIKKALAYSTMSQLGYMVAAMGVGAFSAGLFHLFTHAFFKAMLFLCSGSVIHACEDEQDMRKMGGLMKKLPVTGWTYLAGTVAISGLAYTSGFWSKDEILVGAHDYSQIIYYVLLFTAGLTSFYMFRTYFMTFLGKYRGEAHVHHEDPVMVTPLAILAIPSLFIGALLSGIVFPGWPAFSQYIAYHVPGVEHAAHHFDAFSGIPLTSTIVALIGLFAAFFMYGPMRVIDPDMFRRLLAPLYNLSINKWYFDDIYDNFVENYCMVSAKVSSWFDRTVIDGLVNGTALMVMSGGSGMRQLQSGKVQVYLGALFFSVFILSLAFIYWLR
ncbi:MAG: NADH-quinone oxidoreductase subunit L [Vampirovibrio sp.]|nr:NADH-quinone oxidoreductase subunit L [Vampirovibrio sp.]